MISSQSKLTLQSDIYAIGAILFRLLLDSPPPKEVTEDIHEQKMHKENPDDTVFNIPYFCKDFIMSNELCQILVNLLHSQQKHRYEAIPIVR